MIGKKIQLLRKEKKLTQEELAYKLSISRSSLSLYETDKREPDSETLLKFAEYFNVTLDYLFSLTDIPNCQKPPQKNTKPFNTQDFLNSSEKKIIKIFQRLKTDKFKEKAIIQFEAYVDTLTELEAEFEELEETGSVKPDSVPSTQ